MSHVKAENDHDSGLASNRTTYVIGTRESQLAMVQTTHVKTLLETLHPTLTFEVKGMSTTGDNIQDVALSKIGSKSLFTKELEVALHQKTVDLVVHSLKDLPTQLPPGMFLGAILERELPNDVVIMGLTHTFKKLADLPAGSVIGTSSVRRSAQLRRRYPSLMFQDIRGNLNTRLRKLDDASSPFAALLLAYAGVHRLGWTDRISEILPTSTLLYAVGQGAIAVECREFDHEVKDLLKPLSHPATLITCTAEREFMRVLEGGCSVPLGVSSSISTDSTGVDMLNLTGSVTSLDGTVEIRHAVSMPMGVDSLDDRLVVAANIGQELAMVLTNQGAKAILDEIRHANNH